MPARSPPAGRLLRPRFGKRIDLVASLAAALLLALLAFSVLERDLGTTAPTPDAADAPRAPAEPYVAAVADDHVELRSGPVTLVLVTTDAGTDWNGTAGPRTLEDE